MKKIILRTLLVLAVLVIGCVIYVNLTWDKTFEAPTPEIKASTDSAIIERGRHLVYGPAHCASCHVPLDKARDIDNGVQLPLSGGFTIDIPPGLFTSPNLTPDAETGIGKITDGQLARALRYSVDHNNRAMFPFMPFQELSDEDVTAIISFLRSQPAVKNETPTRAYTFLGKALSAFGSVIPEGPKNTPPHAVKIDTTVEYGSYLANRVANCVGCHTNRDLKTGKIIGEPFAGGLALPKDAFSEGFTFVSPNITPDKETSVIADWSEEAFVNRFHGGRLHKGSPMAWGSFSRMDDLELKAIYRYLQTVKPVKNKIIKTVYKPDEEVQ